MNQLVILAGGKGSRMKSSIPKSLQKIGRQTIIGRLLLSVKNIFPKPVIVVGYKGNQIIETLGDDYVYVWQDNQLGTAHALSCTKGELKNIENIIVLPGDHPLVRENTIQELLNTHETNENVLTIATVLVPNFEGEYKLFEHYGRIQRDEMGKICGIVEYKDATEEQRNIKELNISYYCFRSDWLWNNLPRIGNNNAAKEYYLTDIIKFAVEQKQKISAVILYDHVEAMGVNSLEELHIATVYAN